MTGIAPLRFSSFMIARGLPAYGRIGHMADVPSYRIAAAAMCPKRTAEERTLLSTVRLRSPNAIRAASGVEPWANAHSIGRPPVISKRAPVV